MSYEFADRLIELRKAKGMSQEELAQRIGLSRQAVSKWERAESSPDIGNLVALAEIYELTIDEIVKGAVGEEASTEAGSPDAFVEDVVVEVEEPVAEGMTVEGESAPIDDPFSHMPPPDPSQRVEIPESFVPGASAVGQPPAGAAPVAEQPAAATPFPEQPPVTHVNIDHMHIDPSMTEHGRGRRDKRPKDPLLTFPYPVAVAVIFLLAGFIFGWWHPAWIIFLTIPFYYWIVNIIVKDPNYQARHGYFDE